MALKLPIVVDQSYNDGIEIVHMFVQAKDDPTPERQTQVHEYYMQELRMYWDRVLAHITGPQLAQAKSEHPKLIRIGRYDNETFSKYQKQVRTALDALDRNFVSTGRVDIKAIGNLFRYMGNKVCLSMGGLLFPSTENDYPLNSELGYFGINTYLYAFFNGIYLVGVPDRISTFDEMEGCPDTFINHDFLHNNAIRAELIKDRRMSGLEAHEVMAVPQDFYYAIIEDSITPAQRELHLWCMFIILHEIYDWKYTMYSRQSDPALQFLQHSIVKKMGLDNAGRVDPVYTPYWDIFGTEENIQSLMRALISVYDSPDSEPSNWINRILAEWDSRSSLAEFILNTRSDRILYLLASWYHLRYFAKYLDTGSVESNDSTSPVVRLLEPVISPPTSP